MLNEDNIYINPIKLLMKGIKIDEIGSANQKIIA